MLSFHILLFDFKFFIIFFMSFSSIGVNWDKVSRFLFFKYDLNLSFQFVVNLFASCGPIFMKKLLNCVAISFLSVILASLFALKYVGNCLCIFNLLITSAIFSHVFLMSIPEFTDL